MIQNPSNSSIINPNYLINGGFEVNQRGVASQNASGKYPIDQWSTIIAGSTCTASQQTFTVGQTEIPGEPKNYVRAVVSSTAGTGNRVILFQRIEDVRTLAGQTCTLSFWAKASVARPIAVEFNQVFGSGGSPSTSVNAIGVSKLTLSTSWTKYTISVVVPNLSGKTIGTDLNTSYLTLIFWLDAGSDFNARTNTLGQNCVTETTFEFAQVKLEAGTVATPFYSNYAEELRKCMRYLQVFGGSSVYEVVTVPLGALGTAGCLVNVVLKTRMRAIPTLIAPLNVGNFALWDGYNPSTTVTSMSISSTTSGVDFVIITVGVASGLTQYRPYVLHMLYQTTDRFILSAEL